MEEELGYNPALWQLQDFNQAGAQLECNLSEETQKLAHKCKDWWLKLVRKHEWKWVRMAKEGHTTFQEVFLRTSSANSVKLLPWCISPSIPFHYMDDALVTAMWQGRNAPATMAAPKPEEPPTQGLSSSPVHQTETPPPIIPLLPYILFMSTLPWGTHSLSPLPTLCRKSGTTLPVALSVITAVRGPTSIPQR